MSTIQHEVVELYFIINCTQILNQFDALKALASPMNIRLEHLPSGLNHGHLRSSI